MFLSITFKYEIVISVIQDAQMEPAMMQLYTENRAQFDAKVREHVQKVGMI
jgi:hypothetical protein